MNTLKNLLLIAMVVTLAPFVKADNIESDFLLNINNLPSRNLIPDLSLYQLKNNAKEFAAIIFERNKSNYPFFNTESRTARYYFTHDFQRRFQKKFRNAEKFIDLVRNNQQKSNDIIRKISIDSLVSSAKAHMKDKIAEERYLIRTAVDKFRAKRSYHRQQLDARISKRPSDKARLVQQFDETIKNLDDQLQNKIKNYKDSTKSYRDNVVRASLAKPKLNEFKSSDFGIFLLQKWNVPAVDPNNIIFSE